MYNTINGNDENARELLLMLRLSPLDCGRFRDCYLSKDGERIIVYTRNGGGNREAYQDVFDKLSEHPNYIKDYDDDFDSTYASIEFSVPDKYKDRCKQLLETADTRTGAERMQDMLNAFDSDPDEAMKNNPALKNLVESFQRIVEGSQRGGVYTIGNDGTIQEVGDSDE